MPNLPAWAAFSQVLRRIEKEKLAPWLGLRNALGVVLPLAIGVAVGEVPTALVAGTGALIVSFSDGDDPYPQRAKRMLAASSVVSVAVFLGASCANNAFAAVVLATLWAFAAGTLVAVSTAAGDIGVVSLVTLVVFSAQPMSVGNAAAAGAFALAGALVQTALSLALWPVRRYEPERRALSNLYHELGKTAADPVHASQMPPASQASLLAHTALETLAHDRSVTGERYRHLLAQAERIRLSLLILRRLHSRMDRDRNDAAHTETLAAILQETGKLLLSVGDSLLPGAQQRFSPECLPYLAKASKALDEPEPASFFGALVADARFHTDALAGQLRAALEMTAYSSPEGLAAFAEREARQPWGLRIQGTFAILRANLSLRSTAFRHAVRLAACIAIGDALGRSLGWSRSYWVPMTIAIVLKPDFTATFSRGVLRLAGTFAGLLLATGLFYVLPPNRMAEVLLIGVFMYILRWAGPANYGIFVTAVTALVVLLFALTGVKPAEVVADRGWNTIAGGAIALVAYGLWPTWERHQIGDTTAALLDAYREYYQSVSKGYLNLQVPADLERTRIASRLARSNLEAAMERTKSEPGFPAARAEILAAIFADSHRLIHAIMALEAGLSRSRAAPARDAFHAFSNAVELTLYYLASALRGSPLRPSELPDLRRSHRELTEAGDPLTERYALVNIETDRVTNSLNTLSGHLFEWLGRKPQVVEDKM